MNYSNHRFTLDIQLQQAQVSVPATLNDTARRLCVGLTDGRKPYIIADGCTAAFAAKKPDGFALYNQCTIENNTVIYEFTPQTANVAGTYECEIRLYNEDGKQLTSPRFLLVVDEQAIDDDDVIDSFTEVTMLNQIISNETERINAENARTSAEDARVDNENTRISNEQTRSEQELWRVSAENERKSNEDARIEAEIRRENEEASRGSYELDRTKNENTRISNENTRKSNENVRISNEQARSEQELWRVSAENERKSNEDARIEAEIRRENEEASRGSYEIDRINNENTRISNEAARNAKFTELENRTEALESDAAGILLRAYPVGSIYISVNSTSPASLFGGTWTQLKDRFLIGAGGSYSANGTGGAASVSLGYSNLPTSVLRAAKNYKTTAVSVNGAGWGNSSIAAGVYTSTTVDSADELGDTYSGKTNVSTMPPYLAVYMWKRTA